jgi:cob(I)alamin adenosyltransferase
MSKIYTKKGDNGMTSLYNGECIEKDDSIIDLLGYIDELNSFIGILDLENEFIYHIQTWLFDLGTVVANPDHKYNFDLDLINTKKIENEIDIMTEKLPKLTKFILPKGNINLCRAICRKLERKLVFNVFINKHIPQNTVIFINRLSDYLFTLARYVNFIENKEEVFYKKSNILSAVDNS